MLNMNLNSEELRAALLERFDYKPAQVDSLVERLLSMDESIRAAFAAYLESGEIPDQPRFSGAAPSNLAAAYPQKLPSIFLLLDWIRRDSKAAYAALVDEYGRWPEKLPPALE